jgi:hypothetical protein
MIIYNTTKIYTAFAYKKKINSKWIHRYYVKNDQLTTMPLNQSCSWILKAILHQRESLSQLQGLGANERQDHHEEVYNLMLIEGGLSCGRLKSDHVWKHCAP